MGKIAPGSVQFLITNKCSLKCEFCDEAALFSLQTFIEKTGPIFKILDYLKDWGVEKITFSGGEPTLVDNLGEILAKAKEIGFEVALATNGLALGKKTFFESICKNIDVLKLPLHGIKKTHDEIVGRSGAFAKIISVLKHALDYRPCLKTEITCVITKDNCCQLDKVLDICLKYQVDQLTLSEVYPRGWGKNYQKAVGVEEIKKLKELVLAKNLFAKEKIKIVLREAKPSCVLVYPSGEVFVSHFQSPSGLHFLGNIFTDDVKTQWKTSKWRKEFENNYLEFNK